MMKAPAVYTKVPAYAFTTELFHIQTLQPIEQTSFEFPAIILLGFNGGLSI